MGDTKADINTIGVNWYANDAVKVAANYVMTTTDGITNANGDDDGDAFVMRQHYVFYNPCTDGLAVIGARVVNECSSF